MASGVRDDVSHEYTCCMRRREDARLHRCFLSAARCATRYNSYNTEEKAYTYYGVDSGPMIMAEVPLGKVDGKTWVYNSEGKMNGKMVKSRYTMVEQSPTSYTFKWEVQKPDGTWAGIMEGTSTKSATAQATKP